MPIQTWTAGQQLTAAELTAVTNMLPAPQVATANVASAVPGTLYRCQPTGGGNITITLPSPTLGNVAGMTLDSATGTCTLQHNATELIYGVDVDSNGARGAASLTLSQPDTYVAVVADGTNWHEYGTAVSAPWKFYDNTLGSAVSSVTIPASGSIPSGWSTVEIDLFLRSTTVANYDQLNVQFNGNTTGTAYGSLSMSGNGTSAISGSTLAAAAGAVSNIPAANVTANVYGSARIVIPNYGASGPLSWTAFWGLLGVSSFVGTNAGFWANNGPLTSILFTTQSGANFIAGSRIVVRLLP